MKKVYVDPITCKCYTTNQDGNFREVEHDFFADKCDSFIEGYCVKLYDNGTVRSFYPWKPYSELDAAQREHEKQLLADYESALSEIETTLGVTV